MGDNANQIRDWHNQEVGRGYQSAGVVRQRGPVAEVGKILDMRGPVSEETDSSEECGSDKELAKKKARKEGKKEKKKKDSKKERKERKEKKIKKSKKEKKKENSEDSTFNPFLQVLATRISNTTREFTINNGY